MVPSSFDDRRDFDATDVVAAVVLGCCVCFGGLALLDLAVGTEFWPTDAEYGTTLLVYVAVYRQFQRRLRGRERTVAVGLVTTAICAMVAAAYTNPEGPLLPLALLSLLAGGFVGLNGVVRSFGTSRGTDH